MPRKSKNTKKLIIPALCIVASLAPSHAKANWAAGIGYLISGIVSGTGTAIASRMSGSNSTGSAEAETVQKTPYVEQHQQKIVHTQPVIIESKPVVRQYEIVTSRPKQKKVYYRVVSERKIERPGQDPIIETVYEEVPVQTSQQQPVRYITNQGR